MYIKLKSFKALNLTKSCKIFYDTKKLFWQSIIFVIKKEKKNIKRKKKIKVYDLTPSGRD